MWNDDREVIDKNLNKWVPTVGKWEFKEGIAEYIAPLAKSLQPFGIALGEEGFRSGSIKTKIRFDENVEGPSGRIIIGYHPATSEYYTVGLGGYGYAYVISEFRQSRWRGLKLEGDQENLSPNTDYEIEVKLEGQRVGLRVDGIKVIEYSLPRPLKGDQFGLFAWGKSRIQFKDTKITKKRPTAFVIMKFDEPYFDELYKKIIKPVAENSDMDLHAYRADEIYKPGIILKDIVSGITESEVIIAEITSLNPNVFYELGYSHCRDKETILLAEEGTKLPFDISGYRCIFYNRCLFCNNRYLFSWESVPGDDNEKLIRFLIDNFDIDQVENAEIRKSGDGKTIYLSKNEILARIMLEDKEEKAILKLSDGRIHDLKVIKDNGKLNIYDNSTKGGIDFEDTLRKHLKNILQSF